jgi:hypothetical protein
MSRLPATSTESDGARPVSTGRRTRPGQGHGQPAAGVALRVFAGVGRAEGAHGLAHEREVSGERPHREDHRLVRVERGLAGPAVLPVQGRGQAGAAQALLGSGELPPLPAARREVVVQDGEGAGRFIPAPPPRGRSFPGNWAGARARRSGTSFRARQWCGQKAAQRAAVQAHSTGWRPPGRGGWRPPGRPGRTRRSGLHRAGSALDPPALRMG